MASIKTNILLNGLNTVTAIIFPVITFPYAARVLMPEGIGTVDFLHTIINYIILLCNIGIPLYALKEVAKYQDNKPIRDKITIEILTLSTALCILGYIIVWALATFVPKIHQNSSLFYVLSLAIIFTMLGVNWFYQGIENFKFITKRAIIIRILAAISLFIFVKNPKDILIYCFIVVGSTVGNNLINIFHLRKHLDFRSIAFKRLEVIRHIKPSLKAFTLSVVISIYSYTTTILLGFFSDASQVGYFSGGIKISLVAITLISSICYVLIPKASHLVKKGEMQRFGEISIKTLRLITSLSLPIMSGMYILSTPLVMVFCGLDYVPSISVLCVNVPVVLFSNINLLLSLQILYPMDKVKTCLICMSVGAITNIILNVALDSILGSMGASIAKTGTEFAIMLMLILIGKKYYPFSFKFSYISKYIYASIFMAVLVWIISKFIQNYVLSICIGGFTGCIIYLTSLILMKDSLIMELLNSVKNHFHLK